MPLVRKPLGSPDNQRFAEAGGPDGLHSADEDVRWAAARAAADAGHSVGMLAEALRAEPAARVREAIFTSLARIGGEASALAVLPLLRSNDASLRTGALDALRTMITSARDLLPALLNDADVDIRILSCDLARLLPADEAIPLLCDRLQRDPDANVCAAAVDVLAEAGNQQALPALTACAQRFRDVPYLVFAVQFTVDRIGNLSPSERG